MKYRTIISRLKNKSENRAGDFRGLQLIGIDNIKEAIGVALLTGKI